MYTAFVGVKTPGQDGMRYAPFPINNTVSGLGIAGLDRCAISRFASKPGMFLNFAVVVDLQM